MKKLLLTGLKNDPVTVTEDLYTKLDYLSKGMKTKVFRFL